MAKIFNELHEECGVFGVYNVPNASSLTYFGLHALQHRGQEGCGMVVVNEDGKLAIVKGEGLVTEIFNINNLKQLSGNMAIGHVRYSTTGSSTIDNVQPFMFKHHHGDFALGHNGSLVNANELRLYLEKKGSLFQSSSDSEILAHLIKKGDNNNNWLLNIKDALNMLEGAFSFVIQTKDRLYACRDKHGFRPLVYGKLGDGYIVSSETSGLDIVNAEYIRDIEPGEILCFSKEGVESINYSMYRHYKMCAMEYIYFARPDSSIEGLNVHAFRRMSGKILARETGIDGDIVIGIPDSSISAAIGYSEESGIPYEMGLIKNKYTGRTFIQPSQELRERGVLMKLSPVKPIVNGKKVILIDDSVVRGTTSKRIVKMLREAGAKEVHLRIASPQIISPCFYGVNMTTYEELMSACLSLEDMVTAIGVDSLKFLSIDGLHEASQRNELCTACFTNKYPTNIYNNMKTIKK